MHACYVERESERVGEKGRMHGIVRKTKSKWACVCLCAKCMRKRLRFSLISLKKKKKSIISSTCIIAHYRAFVRAFYFLAFRRLFLYRDIYLPLFLSYHHPFIHSLYLPVLRYFFSVFFFSFVLSLTRSFLWKKSLRWSYFRSSSVENHEINIFNSTPSLLLDDVIDKR